MVIMCWEKEDKYDKCFDHVWGLNVDDGIKDLLIEAGVEFINEETCKVQFFELLSSWHEKGMIKPHKNDIQNKELYKM